MILERYCRKGEARKDRKKLPSLWQNRFFAREGERVDNGSARGSTKLGGSDLAVGNGEVRGEGKRDQQWERIGSRGGDGACK